MPPTPVAERLAHLRDIREKWTAQLQALKTTDPHLIEAFAQAVGDLDDLIQQLESDDSE